MQTCMKLERQPSTGLSIAYKSTDQINILNSSCLVRKETEFQLDLNENIGAIQEGLYCMAAILNF
jgi:hypothetical protein